MLRAHPIAQIWTWIFLGSSVGLVGSWSFSVGWDLFINSFAIMNAVSSNGGKPIGATALWNQLAEAQAKHTVAVGSWSFSVGWEGSVGLGSSPGVGFSAGLTSSAGLGGSEQ